MEDGQLLLTLLILIPSLANITSFNIKALKNSTMISSTISLLLSILLLIEKGSLLPIVGLFYVTSFTVFFILMINSIYLLSSVYSLEYIEDKDVNGLLNSKTYYVLLNFFVSSMLFTVSVNNFGFMWIGVELTTITSALLITTEYSEVSLEATWRYIIIVSAGVTIALFSIILIYYQYHTLTVSTLLSLHQPSKLIELAVGLALIGFGTKVGVFPMYTWLPDAHSEAPSPVSALFSGVLLPSVLYVLYRVYQLDPLANLYLAFSVLSILTASVILTYQWNIKRLFAYSTIENMNLALIGLTIGQPAGALILLLSHAFGKASAFYSSGVLVKVLKEKRIDEFKGVNRLKLASSSLLLASLAVTGTPPFGTFVGEFLILRTLLERGLILPLIVLLIAIPLEFISINYHVNKVIFSGGEKGAVREPPIMSSISLISSIISLVIGVFYLLTVM
ncbi:proton-conducting transporter membrane subunit [Stygiolobus caldivivus]|uniref:NADH dehydrogenase n=1 Tax=Stygiolobus caldivivus TaxID=2824673 RepID=A0A8D5ZJ59_9CREN|nr:proton-conducting transporter membrane subunit [Stygiolobus caldivivus]BCU70261.1 NADH dehydrogenase [Stygiolobus caldivivus]